MRPVPIGLRSLFRVAHSLEPFAEHDVEAPIREPIAVARALMTNPALLLLDEPLEGLAPIIVEELAAAIRRMAADEGTAFILVEQHAEVALSLTRDAIVLERGSIVHRARSQDLLGDHATLERLIGLRLQEP